MKDTAPGPDEIPYSVYGKLWEQAGSLILNILNYSNTKNELSREQKLSTIMFIQRLQMILNTHFVEFAELQY
jgi:hypothetical protein